MNSRKLSQAADFSGGMTKSACSANDIVAACRRVHENAPFFHSPDRSVERFECSTQFAGDAWLHACAAASFCLELLHALQKNVADDGESFGADFVERVLRRVPVVDVAAGTVIEVNHIHRGDVAFQKGLMIVFDGRGVFDENV